jgi:hypothetical protein
LQLLGRVAEDGSGCLGVAIDEEECRPVDAVVALPVDAEAGVGFLDADGLGLSVACQRRGEPILGIEQPSIPRLR